MRGAVAVLGALVLAGCASGGGLTAAQLAEKADTDVQLAYVGIATTLNAVEAADPSKAVAAEAIKRQAWEALVKERALYAAGKAVDVSVMNTFAVQAAALGGH